VLRITVVDPEAEEHCARLTEQHPELAELCELVGAQADIGSPAFQRGAVPLDLPPDYEVTSVYVCRVPDTQGISTAFALSRRPETRSAPTVVALTDIHRGVASTIEESERPFGRLRTFSVVAGALGPDLLQSGMNDHIARATHEGYLRAERARGLTVADNPSLVPWDELPESLKQSNRRFADGVGTKLEATGSRLVPASLTGDHDFSFSDDEIEELAKLEHDRWAGDLRKDGWRPTDGPKDPERKLHPLLVGWSELSEPEREKDRVTIRELPDLLARAGFEIHRDREPQ
jgi:hypothetical protein